MTAITDTERRIWLRQTHVQLGRLLVRMSNEQLPPIRWAISPDRSLLGQCGYGDDPGGEFDAWMGALGEPDQKMMRREDGVTRMTAVYEHYEGCQIVLTATIHDEPAGE